MPDDDYLRRFGSLQRLYGKAALDILEDMHVCIVGLGGVGSWAVESLARSGVGRLTLIDYDTVHVSNVNRQLHALSGTLDRKKFAAMAERVAGINPACRVETIDDFVTLQNFRQLLAKERGYDYVIDAIDRLRIKAAMIHQCKRNKIPIITVGGAGGTTDPLHVKVADLSRTYNDPLAADVRARLRKDHGFTKNTKRYFGVECVFSSQQRFYPRDGGGVCHEKPGLHGVSLDCSFGYGSVSHVTAVFGFTAASRVINKTLHKRLADGGNVEDVASPARHSE